MKNPLTPAGIEPATYRFVAQHLIHCATADNISLGVYNSRALVRHADYISHGATLYLWFLDIDLTSGHPSVA